MNQTRSRRYKLSESDALNEDADTCSRRILHSHKFMRQQLFPSKDVDVLAYISVRKQNDDLMNSKLYRLAITVSRMDFTPKLHKIKVKAPNHFVLKRSWPLKQLILIDGGSKDPHEKKFSLEFTTKKTGGHWEVEPTDAPASSGYKSWFLWFLLQVCGVFLHSVPATVNLDLLQLERTSRGWVGPMLGWVEKGEDSPESLKKLVLAVQKEAGIDVRGEAEDLGDEDGGDIQVLEMPSMSAVEEREVQYYLDAFDIGVGDINVLGDLLREKVHELDSTNISALYSCQGEATSLVEAIGELREDVIGTKTWMTQKDKELKQMRMGIQQVEQRNRKLDLLERNYDKLGKCIELLMQDITLSPENMQELKYPEFEKASGLRQAIKAAEQLRILLQPRLPNVPGLEPLKAVREQRAVLGALNQEFCNKAFIFTKDMFKGEAKEILENSENEEVDTFTIRLSSHENCQIVLRRLQKLMDSLQTLDEKVFKSLRPEYIKAFRVPYGKEIRVLSQTFKEIVSKTSFSRKLANLDVCSLEAFAIQPERSRLGFRKPNRRKHVLKPVQESDSSALSILDAFSLVLKTITPSILTEQEFCSDFFGADFEILRAIGDVGKERGEAEQINSMEAVNNKEMDEMLSVLFQGLDVELEKMAEYSHGLDEMAALGIAELAAVHKETECGYLRGLLEDLENKCRKLFDSLVEEQIAFIQTVQVTPKKCQISAPFLKFPSFVSHVENVLSSARALVQDSEHSSDKISLGSAEIPLQKMVKALFSWIETIAAQDPKYQHVVLALNYHFFWFVFSSREMQLFKSLQVEAHELYIEHVEKYVIWHLNYAMEQVIQFFQQIDSQLKSLSSPTDLPSIISRQSLRALCANELSPSELERSIRGMFSRVHKHFRSSPQVMAQVWLSTREVLGKIYERFENQVALCYRNEKVPLTRAEVSAMFVEGDASMLFQEMSTLSVSAGSNTVCD